MLKAVLGALALAFVAAPARAGATECLPIATPKGATIERGGRWVELTHDQFLFAAGFAASVIALA